VTSASLKHDHAWQIAAAVVEVFASLLRDEEKVDAFREVYQCVRQGLEKYEERADRLRRRLGSD
jgi:hypothetical protein